MISYSLRLADWLGRRLDVYGPGEWVSMLLTRHVNTVGTGGFVLPLMGDWEEKFQVDYRLTPMMSIEGGPEVPVGDMSYLIRSVSAVDSDAGQYVQLDCPDLLDIPNTHGVPYYSETPQANKTGAADNIILQLAAENFGALASDYSGIDPGRAIPSSRLVVGDLKGQGAVIDIAAAWRPNLLEVMQEAAAASRRDGVYIAFDMVTQPNAPILFDTFAGQRGMDRRRTVTLSRENKSLSSVQRTKDYRSLINVVYATGDGDGRDRQVTLVTAPERLTGFPWAWRETITSGQSDDSSPFLATDARARLDEGRPKEMFLATLTDSPNCIYGLDVAFGDYVSFRGLGRETTARLELVTLGITQAGRKITAGLEADA